MKPLSYLRKPIDKYLFDGCKLIWHKARVKDWLDGKRIYPLHIDMGITKYCNMRCIYCYGVKQKMSGEHIPEDRLLMLVEDAVACGIKSLAVIGDGEPTLNKGLYPMVQLAKEKGLDMSVATNGLPLTDTQLVTLCKSLVWLRFNVSGVDDKYDEIHSTKKMFSKFQDIVQKAVAVGKFTGCTIGLQMVLIPQCFDQVIPLAEYAVKWGVDYLVIKQFSDGGEGMPIHMDMNSYDRVQQDLATAEGMSNDKTKIIIKWNAINDTRSITDKGIWGFDRCIDLPFIFQISGNGECYPCGYMFGNSDYCYGNVTKDRLKTILDSDRYWGIIKKVAETPLAKLCKGQCRHCETNKFIDQISKKYNGDMTSTLIDMCGGLEQYNYLMTHIPEHSNFI